MADLNDPQAWRSSQYKEAVTGQQAPLPRKARGPTTLSTTEGYPNIASEGYKPPQRPALQPPDGTTRATEPTAPAKPSGPGMFSSRGAIGGALDQPGAQNVMQSADVGVRSLGQQAKEILAPDAAYGRTRNQPIGDSTKGTSAAASTPANTIPSAPQPFALPPKSMGAKPEIPGSQANLTPDYGFAMQNPKTSRGVKDIGSQPTSALGTASPGTGDSGAANMAQRLGGTAEATQPDYGGNTSPRGSQTPNQGALPGPSTKYGEHAWDDGPKKMGGTFSVLPSAGSGGGQALSGQSGQQPGGASGMDLRDLYKQAMTPIDTHAPLMQMMAQVSQRKQARALLEQGIQAQSGVDAANAAGEWGMKQGQQTGQYKLAETGMQGQQALEQGQQTGAFAREREQMGNEAAMAIQDMSGQQASSLQDVKGQQAQALRTQQEGGLNARALLSEQGQQQRGRQGQQHEYDLEQANAMIGRARSGGHVPGIEQFAIKDSKGNVTDYDREALAMHIRTTQADPRTRALSGIGQAEEVDVNDTSVQAALEEGTNIGKPGSENFLTPDTKPTSPGLSLPIRSPSSGRMEENSDTHLGDLTKAAAKFKMTPGQLKRAYYDAPEDQQAAMYKQITGRDDYHGANKSIRSTTQGEE